MALHHDCLPFRSFLAPLPAAGEFGRWAVRVFLACFAIVMLGVVPSMICLVLIGRRMIPKMLHAFGWFFAGATGLLALILFYVVRIAGLALRATSSG